MDIVSLDSEEEEIKRCLHQIAKEFREGNAQLVSISEFGNSDTDTSKNQSLPDGPATFVQLMISNMPERHDPEFQSLVGRKALDVIEGHNIQVTHSEKIDRVSWIGFTQL